MSIFNSRSKHHRPMRPIQFPQQTLPHYVDLRKWMTPIVHQKHMKTCVANAFASACEYILKRRTGQYIPISRLFIYYNGQIIDQRTFSVEDTGSSRMTVALGMRKFGICREELWPYKSHLVNKRPPDNVYEEAKNFTVTPLKIPLDIIAIKACLANQVPALAGIKLKDEANYEAKANRGYISIPDPNDIEIVNTFPHVVLLVGYDDNTQHFIARNSWGPDWGYHGYFYIPYEYFLDKRLVNHSDSLWAITEILRRSDHLPTMQRLAMPHHHQDRLHHRSNNKACSSIRTMTTKRSIPYDPHRHFINK